MSDDAKKHLDALAGWFITSKTSQVNENAEKCADDERHARLEPFLRKMGLYKKVRKIMRHKSKKGKADYL